MPLPVVPTHTTPVLSVVSARMRPVLTALFEGLKFATNTPLES